MSGLAILAHEYSNPDARNINATACSNLPLVLELIDLGIGHYGNIGSFTFRQAVRQRSYISLICPHTVPRGLLELRQEFIKRVH